MKPKKIKCEEAKKYLSINLGEDLDLSHCLEIKKHIEQCPMCKKYFETLEITIKCYQNYNVELSDECHHKLLNKLGLED
ncbi:MAG: hypothetical protein JXA68_03000 [Ignavibacteriales bacterium]|nr:hypothetical protein [Ignavibacteriales bacterium]